MAATTASELVNTTRLGVGARTDAELVDAVRAGDDAAFERLYERYNRRVAYYVYGMVHDYGRAEDIAQEVFMSALRRMRQTDRAIAFKPWIYEIAKNACIDQFRRSQRRSEVSFDSDDGSRLPHLAPAPDAAVEQKQSLDDLCGAFGGLSEIHHKVLVMRELEGLSYDEIGQRLDMTRPAVESTLFRARRRLAEEYEELVTGERCRRVQAIVDSASEGALGARDRRRMAVHVSHCQSCRRHAYAGGVEIGDIDRTKRGRVAAVLPFPFLLRRGGSHSSTLVQWAGQTGATIDPSLAGWARAAVAAVTVAIAGVGAGTQGSHIASALMGTGHSRPAHVTTVPSSQPRAVRPVHRSPVHKAAPTVSVGARHASPSRTPSNAGGTTSSGGGSQPPAVGAVAKHVPSVPAAPKVSIDMPTRLAPLADATGHPIRRAAVTVSRLARTQVTTVKREGGDAVDKITGLLHGS